MMRNTVVSTSPDVDAVVVGAGPNGLLAAITLAQAGMKVVVFEAGSRAGGGMRSEELTNPGVIHDVCSAVHPLALASPAMRALPLADHGVTWLQPRVAVAHPLDDGRAALIAKSIEQTTASLGSDAATYRRRFSPFVKAGSALVDASLGGLNIPISALRHSPAAMVRYGLTAPRSAEHIANWFSTPEARAAMAGMAAHSILPLDEPITGAMAVFFTTLAHHVGWPVVKGGSQQLADALVSILKSHGGDVFCGRRIRDLGDLPSARAVVLDLTPRQVLAVADEVLPGGYVRKLRRFRYGPGVFKLDLVLDGPIPWTNPAVAEAGTVHVGGTFEEVAAAEKAVSAGDHPERPFVLLSQPSIVDGTRAPAGQHVVWAYCHVPHASRYDMTEAIESQIERFAPGFRDRIIARHTMDSAALENHNANEIGGDINGGMSDWRQLFFRPSRAARPWATPVEGLYLCSSSTPPGGGVHGMGGLHAANEVLCRVK
ncbi:MAG: phytoene desaturase family protein [Acidimicrobiia bacterium]